MEHAIPPAFIQLCLVLLWCLLLNVFFTLRINFEFKVLRWDSPTERALNLGLEELSQAQQTERVLAWKGRRLNHGTKTDGALGVYCPLFFLWQDSLRSCSFSQFARRLVLFWSKLRRR